MSSELDSAASAAKTSATRAPEGVSSVLPPGLAPAGERCAMRWQYVLVQFYDERFDIVSESVIRVSHSFSRNVGNFSKHN